jgi:multidrug efflux pump subunit AcrA (membrane-fusion protein)
MTRPMSSRHRARAEQSAAGRRAQRRRRTRWSVLAGVLAGVLAVGGVAFAANRETGDPYRTATAGMAAVAQTVDAVGTVASASRADAAFSVAGTVATVDVAVGDVIEAGDVLATLDPTSLQEALDQAESTLADAEQQLEDDLESQTTTTSSSTSVSSTGTAATAAGATATGATASTGTGTTGGTTTAGPGAGGAVASAIDAVTQAQAALLAQYDAVAAALATSEVSLTASQAACETFLSIGDAADGETDPATEPTAEPTADPVIDPVTDPATDPVTDPATDPVSDPATMEALVACQAALGVVQTDQQAVDAAATVLLDLAAALDAAVAEAQETLTAAAISSGASSSSTPSSSTPSTSATVSSGGGSNGVEGQSTQTSIASAEDILADRATIDAATADVAIAQAQLGMIRLTSPIAGTIGAVSLAPGDGVTASSTSAVVTVLGDTGHAVSMALPLSVIDTVEVGQNAEATVAGTDELLTGTVTSIGVLDVSDSSTPEYTVVVSLDPTDARLFDGASAQVTIMVGGNEKTLTVPTSAVHVDGATTTVTVLRDGEPVAVEVTTGAVGSELTEILEGLAAGDEVVLADLAQSLPAGDTEVDSGLTGLSDTGDASSGGGMGGGAPGGMGPPGAPGE